MHPQIIPQQQKARFHLDMTHKQDDVTGEPTGWL